MGVAVVDAVGAMPVPTSLAFRKWLASWLNYRLAQRPKACTTTFYFSTSGNDSNDGLTTATPKQTLAAAQTILDAWTGGVAGVALLFKRGDYWRVSGSTTDALHTTNTQTNVVFGDYGDTSLRKPTFSLFQTSLGGKSFAADWVFHAGNAYKITGLTITNGLAWIREMYDVDHPYTRVTTAAEVVGTAATWYYDAGATTLYMQARNSGNPNSFPGSFEGLASNTKNGLFILGDLNLATNIRVDGYGFDNSALPSNNVYYGLYLGLYGDHSSVLNGCECYYSLRGPFLQGAANGIPGGCGAVVNGRFGCIGKVAQACTVLTCVNSYGGQEMLAYGNVATGNYGLPDTTYAAVGPVFHLIHTDGSIPSYYVAWNNTAEQGPGQVEIVPGFSNHATFTDLIDCRAFLVDDVFECRLPVAGDSNKYIFPQSGSLDNFCNINPRWVGRVLEFSQAFGAVRGNTMRGVWWNYDFTLSLIGLTLAQSKTFYLTNAATDFTAECYHGAFTYTDFYFPYSGVFVAGFNFASVTAATGASGKIFNSIICGESLEQSGVYCYLYVGLNNLATHLLNNYYGSIADLSNATYGYSLDTDAVTGWGPPGLPYAGGPLVSANTVLIRGEVLEYDANWQPRNPVTTIGPREVVTAMTPPPPPPPPGAAPTASGRWIMHTASEADLDSETLYKRDGDTLWLAWDACQLPEITDGSATIASADIDLSGSGLTLAGQLTEDTEVGAYYSGGTAGTTYTVTITATLSDDTVYERSGYLTVNAS